MSPSNKDSSSSSSWQMLPATEETPLNPKQKNDHDSTTSPWWRCQWRIVMVALLTMTLLLLAGVVYMASSFTTSHANASTLSFPSDSMDPSVEKLLQELDSKLHGRVITRHSSNFETAAHVWNQVTRPPLAVVQVANEADVAHALPILIELSSTSSSSSKQVNFRIRSGGHQYAGWSGIEDGIILSLSNLNTIQGLELLQDHADDTSTTPISLRLGPVVRVQDVLNQVHQPFGYSTVIGMCRTVAVGGYALGGGQGLWARYYGLGTDQIVGARLVLANGTLIETNATHRPDILWALQGAGQQNFGVVTQLNYQFYPSYDKIAILVATINRADMPLFFHRVAKLERQKKIPQAVGAFYSNDNFYTNGTDAWASYSISIWYTCFQDSDLAIGQEYFQEEIVPLLPSSSTFNLTTYSWYDLSMNMVPLREGNYVRIWNGFLYAHQNTLEACQEIWSLYHAAGNITEYAKVGIELWGGAISEVPPDATAFYWREGIYNVHLWLNVPVTIENAPKRFDRDVAALEPIWEGIAKHLTGTYLNYAEASLEHDDYARITYGGNLERLVELKRELDPNNVFSNPQSLPPSVK